MTPEDRSRVVYWRMGEEDDVEVTVIKPLLGATATAVTGAVGDEEMVLTLTDGRRVRFHHMQDCCESVAIEDIVGSLDTLVGAPFVLAEEVTKDAKRGDSSTWTFYHLATLKGTVTVRWLGESNGYYSESVDVTVEKP